MLPCLHHRMANSKGCDARRAPESRTADDYSIGADNFFVVSPRLTAHANATHAAKLMAQHIAHHRQLGFSGHSVFLNRCAGNKIPPACMDGVRAVLAATTQLVVTSTVTVPFRLLSTVTQSWSPDGYPGTSRLSSLAVFHSGCCITLRIHVSADQQHTC
jgi:hypothetical protein